MPRDGRTVRAKVDQMVRRIVRRFDPDRIILFGSHARGQARPDSDVDLLIVMPVAGSRRETQIEIVVTPADFAWRKDVVGTIERIAVREGKSLYVRHQ